MSGTPYRALEIGPDGWAHGVSIGAWDIDRPDTALDPEADPDAATTIREVVDSDDCDAIIAAWEAEGRPLLLVDADHSADLGTSTAAYFWVAGMRRCPDGIEVLLQPTALGQRQVVDGRVWRYLSPVFPWSGYIYTDAARKIGHPRRMTNFGLTNLPRMRQNRPVVHAAGGAAGATHQHTREGTKRMDPKAMLLSLLRLDPASSDEQIQAAYDAELAARADADAEAAMNSAGIPADQAARTQLKAIWRADAAAGLNAVKAAGAALNARPADGAARPPQRALHTEPRRTPLSAVAGGTFAAKVSAINSVLAANPGMSRTAAYDTARRQNPEAFA